MLFSVTLLLLGFGFSNAAPTDWNGKFTDSMYGGNLAICTSLIGSVYYGQGVISNIGIVRGTISGNVFTGEFYLAGQEAKRGTFSLTLNADVSTGYTGTFSEEPNPAAITIAVTGSRVTNTAPSEVECMKVDNSMLTRTAYTDITGVWYRSGNSNPYYYAVDSTAKTEVSSYSYIYADGTVSPGTSYGTVYLNGQLLLENWYERGADEGMTIILAKNDTAAYSIWWFYSRISDFDYSQVTDPDFWGTQFFKKDTSYSSADVFAAVNKNTCYMLSSKTYEDSCLASYSAPTSISSDNDDAALSDMVGATVAFSVLVFLLLVGIVAYLCFKGMGSTASLSKQESSSNV